MENQSLKVQKREVSFLGKKAKNLRKKGFLPATIYGAGMEALSLQIDKDQVVNLFNKGSHLGLINLTVEGEKTKRPAILQNIQKHPVWGKLLHLEFLQVDLSKKISAKIPLVFKGQPKAVKDGQGTFLSLLDEVEVEGLPQNLPSQLEVAVDDLSDVDQTLTVADLPFLADFVIKTPAAELICKIGAWQKEEEPPVATEAPAAQGGEAEAAPEKTSEENNNSAT